MLGDPMESRGVKHRQADSRRVAARVAGTRPFAVAAVAAVTTVVAVAAVVVAAVAAAVAV